jgi:hypothetical protein
VHAGCYALRHGFAAVLSTHFHFVAIPAPHISDPWEVMCLGTSNKSQAAGVKR